MDEVRDFIRNIGKTFDSYYGLGDVIDVLRIAHHTRRQQTRTTPHYPMPGMPPAAWAGYTAAQRDPNTIMELCLLLEKGVPARSKVGEFLQYVTDLETKLNKAEQELEKVTKAKKVVELPPDAAQIIEELGTLDESLLEAKTVRRRVRDLSSRAANYLQPQVVESDGE